MLRMPYAEAIHTPGEVARAVIEVGLARGDLVVINRHTLSSEDGYAPGLRWASAKNLAFLTDGEEDPTNPGCWTLDTGFVSQ